MIEDKTAVVVAASYRSVSRNPVRFKALVHMIRFSEPTKNLQFCSKTITEISSKICRRLSSFKKSVG